ncbi:MAG: LacI family transcriptional regulator, partial [Bifidobacteriaceae bacterium]|nr:LacI family transcriptional regulator [Bifidobacteriaceae bacterium]
MFADQQLKNATLDDVARAAGVSRATASRAVSGRGHVSPRSREAVRKAVDQLGFAPNKAARSLASRRTGAIALVIPEPNALVLTDPFIGGTIMGASQAFRDTELQLAVVIAAPDQPERKVAGFLHRGTVDGAIMVSHHRSGLVTGAGEATGLPTVFIGRPWGAVAEGTTYVDVDNRAAGYAATAHLIARGARRIGCVAGPEDMTPVADRTAGWRDALAAADLAPGPLRHKEFTLDGGVAALGELLREDPAVDAVFAQSDLMAAGAIRALAAAGRSVPGDVAVVGFDDFEVAASTTPPLTTMTNPAADLAR